MNFHQIVSDESNKIAIIQDEGLTRPELLNKLCEAGIGLNEYARKLIDCGIFDTPGVSRPIAVIECSLFAIGLSSGGNSEAIRQAIEPLNLACCPLTAAPYIRLSYTGQEASVAASSGQSPPGALTIFSMPPSGDDNFPKGFYIRNYAGTLWLRGYGCTMAYCWAPGDRMIFRLPDRSIHHLPGRDKQ